MDRRRFFQLVAGATIAPVAAKALGSISPIPLLVGDGIADDTAALQALLDGLPVEFGPLVDADGVGWFRTTLRMPGGAFRLSGPLVYRGAAPISICENDRRVVAIFFRRGSDFIGPAAGPLFVRKDGQAVRGWTVPD